MVSLPDTMVDLSDTMVDLPDTMVDLSNTMVDLPDTMVDIPTFHQPSSIIHQSLDNLSIFKGQSNIKTVTTVTSNQPTKQPREY